jgi:hypothetical protein
MTIPAAIQKMVSCKSYSLRHSSQRFRRRAPLPPYSDATEMAAMFEEVRFAADSPLEGDGFEPSVPRQKDNAFRDSSFATCARHRRLRKRSPPRPAAASSSCGPRSDERRTHSPTRRSSAPTARHHHPFALIPALCFFRVRFISCSGAVALSRGRAPPLANRRIFGASSGHRSCYLLLTINKGTV